MARMLKAKLKNDLAHGDLIRDLGSVAIEALAATSVALGE